MERTRKVDVVTDLDGIGMILDLLCLCLEIMVRLRDIMFLTQFYWLGIIMMGKCICMI